jgi:hypothetical protein
MPIHSVRVALLHHHKRRRNTNFALVAFVVVMALVHPIYWSLFFVVGVIGLTHPTNVEDGLRWWDLLFSFRSTFLDFDTFKILSGDSFLG